MIPTDDSHHTKCKLVLFQLVLDINKYEILFKLPDFCYL